MTELLTRPESTRELRARRSADAIVAQYILEQSAPRRRGTDTQGQTAHSEPGAEDPR